LLAICFNHQKCNIIRDLVIEIAMQHDDDCRGQSS
jgi:hypothetical protein